MTGAWLWLLVAAGALLWAWMIFEIVRPYGYLDRDARLDHLMAECGQPGAVTPEAMSAIGSAEAS